MCKELWLISSQVQQALIEEREIAGGRPQDQEDNDEDSNTETKINLLLAPHVYRYGMGEVCINMDGSRRRVSNGIAGVSTYTEARIVKEN